MFSEFVFSVYRCMNAFASKYICMYVYIFIVLLLTLFLRHGLIVLQVVRFISEIREIFFYALTLWKARRAGHKACDGVNTIRLETPRKIPDRAPVHLSEEAHDKIRYHFYLLLVEKMYPTVVILLEWLLIVHTNVLVSLRDNSWQIPALRRLLLQYEKQDKGAT